MKKHLSLCNAVFIALLCVLTSGCASTSEMRSKATASLTELHIEVPCGDHLNNTECHWDKALLQTADPKWKLKKEIVRTFAGKQGVVYDVTLHVRGVVEPKNFTAGDVQFEHFQTGGEPIKNDYNFYSLTVSDPAAMYTTNRNAEKVGHYTFVIDYHVTIPIRGGATVTMGAYDSNDVEIANHEHHVVDGITPVSQPFDGQFFVIEVEKIKERK